MTTISCERSDGSFEQVPVDQLKFRISVYGIVFDEQNGEPHVLLVPQPKLGGFDIPGGGIDLGEDIETALKREVFEETGLSVTPVLDPALAVETTFFIHPESGQAYHWLIIYYACTGPEGTLSDANFTAGEQIYSEIARWVPLSEVPSLSYSCGVDGPATIQKAWNVINT